VKKGSPKNVGYFCNLKILPKVNNHPIGENSPNLVTLYVCTERKKVRMKKSNHFRKKEKHFFSLTAD
jgi:hypothetical protein